MHIFVDSDVVISSLLSNSGAAHLLLNTKSIKPFISSCSQKEITLVADRLHIQKDTVLSLFQEKLHMITLSESLSEIKKSFRTYVLDIDDAHIVSGAKAANVQFLITYNMRDFKVEKIKKDLNIITLTPGSFLQYLRSLQ